jgi:serine phosphatase RsbU (regulator of sigma subunit)
MSNYRSIRTSLSPLRFNDRSQHGCERETLMNSITSNEDRKSGSDSRLSRIAHELHTLFQECREAGEVQQHWMPGAAPYLEGLDIAAKAHPWGIVNGDYYDFLSFPNGRLGVIVADAAGKGMPAALLISSLHAHVHALFDEARDLARTIARLNKATCATCPPNRFITFFMAVLDSSGEFVYSNAGHNPPLIVRASGEFQALPIAGMVLGVHKEETYQEGRARLQPNDTLVIFSDGVTEASDLREEPFGVERLARLVAALRGLSSDQIVAAIHREVAAFTRGSEPSDDITVVVVRRTDASAEMNTSAQTS